MQALGSGQGSIGKKARENATLVLLASNRVKQPAAALLIVIYFCASRWVKVINFIKVAT